MDSIKKIKIDGKKGFILASIVLLLVILDQYVPKMGFLLDDNKALWDQHIMQGLFFFALMVVKADAKGLIKGLKK